MTTRERSSGSQSNSGDKRASLPSAFEPIDEVFFNDTRDPLPEEEEKEEDDPLATSPGDHVLVRKMSLAVQARRARFTRLTMGAVGCAALLILVAALMHLVPGSPKASAAAERPAVAPSTQALSNRGATSASAL